MKNTFLKLIIQAFGLLGLLYAFNEYFFNDGVLFARKQSDNYPGVFTILIVSAILVIGPMFAGKNDQSR